MSVIESALAAYRQIPFYHWLYERAGLSEDGISRGQVPVFTRRDLFAYEDECKQPYFCSPRIPQPYDPALLLLTSGTSGRPLPIPVQDVDGRGMHRTLKPIDEALSEVLGTQPVIWTKAEQPSPLLNLISQSMLSGMQFRLISGRVPILRQLEMARYMHCNALLNISGTIALDVMDAKIDPLPYGVRAIVGLYQPKQLTRYFVDLGVKILFFFMSVDSPIAHVGCPHSRSNVFHIRSNDSSHEVILPDGTASSTGEGVYVSTIPGTPFPWVRYSNGDSVIISEDVCPCGFAGRSLTFRGRESYVKIGSGPNVNCDDIYRYYASKDGNGRVVILFGRADSRDFSHRLVVFVEQSVPGPTEIEGEWKTVMTEGAGALDQTCARSIHVIAVPPGLIPKPIHSKPEILVNLEVGDRGELGRLLCNLAYGVTGERIMNPSQSVH